MTSLAGPADRASVAIDRGSRTRQLAGFERHGSASRRRSGGQGGLAVDLAEESSGVAVGDA
jgi:hypothetical protein